MRDRTGDTPPQGEVADGSGTAPQPARAAGSETPPRSPRGRREAGFARGDRVSLLGATLFGIVLLLVGVGLIYLLIKIWPTVPRGGQTASRAASGSGAAAPLVDLVHLRGHRVRFHLIPDTALLALVAVTGAIGSSIFVAISFGDYVGNRRFAKSWIWFYVVRLFIGPAMALIFYFALRGGFLATSSQSSDINPYGVAALGGLVGLFSKQAGDKLHQVFDALFQVDARYGDSTRKDSVTNPAPTISGVDPPITVGATTLEFVLEGSGFLDSSSLSIGRAVDDEQPVLVPRAATYEDQAHLAFTLTEEDVAEPGTLYVSVTNPEPGGGTAGPQPFEVA